MKKLLSLLLVFTGLSVASLAQKAPATAPKKEVKTTKPATTTPSTTPAAPAKTSTTAPVKKDGTPDMRYKANKEAAAPVTHTKNDGTPDKRYKENKKS